MKTKRFKIEPEQADEAETSGENGENEAADCNDGAENGEVQSPQAQTRWTPECTRVMLQLRFERQLEFQQRIRQKKELWSEIAAEMRKQGLCDFSMTAEVCDLKYRNMLQTYKKNRLKEDSGMQSLIAWEYYEIFKEALTAAEEMEAAALEGKERVVPSLLCESVCETTQDGEVGSAVLNTEKVLKPAVVVGLNSTGECIEQEPTDVKSIAETTHSSAVNIRKRSRRSAMKPEMVSPTPMVQISKARPSVSEKTIIVENSSQENHSHMTTAVETQPHVSNIKPDTSAQPPQRKRNCPSFTTTIPTMNMDTINNAGIVIDIQNETPMNSVQNDPIISSSTSAAPMPTTVMHGTPLLQQQQQQHTYPTHTSQPVAPPPVLSQTPINIVHPNHLQAIPAALAPSEMRECQVFGESIGLQLAHVRESHVRATVQLKIQELLYLAKTGKLLETVRI